MPKINQYYDGKLSHASTLVSLQCDATALVRYADCSSVEVRESPRAQHRLAASVMID